MSVHSIYSSISHVEKTADEWSQYKQKVNTNDEKNYKKWKLINKQFTESDEQKTFATTYEIKRSYAKPTHWGRLQACIEVAIALFKFTTPMWNQAWRTNVHSLWHGLREKHITVNFSPKKIETIKRIQTLFNFNFLIEADRMSCLDEYKKYSKNVVWKATEILLNSSNLEKPYSNIEINSALDRCTKSQELMLQLIDQVEKTSYLFKPEKFKQLSQLIMTDFEIYNSLIQFNDQEKTCTIEALIEWFKIKDNTFFFPINQLKQLPKEERLLIVKVVNEAYPFSQGRENFQQGFRYNCIQYLKGMNPEEMLKFAKITAGFDMSIGFLLGDMFHNTSPENRLELLEKLAPIAQYLSGYFFTKEFNNFKNLSIQAQECLTACAYTLKDFDFGLESIIKFLDKTFPKNNPLLFNELNLANDRVKIIFQLVTNYQLSNQKMEEMDVYLKTFSSEKYEEASSNFVKMKCKNSSIFFKYLATLSEEDLCSDVTVGYLQKLVEMKFPLKFLETISHLSPKEMLSIATHANELLLNPLVDDINESYLVELMYQLAEINNDDRRHEIIEIINMQSPIRRSSSLIKIIDDEIMQNEIIKFLTKNSALNGANSSYDEKVRYNMILSSFRAIKTIPYDQLSKSLQFALHFIPYIDNLGDLNQIAAKAVGIPPNLQKLAIKIILEVIYERNRDSEHPFYPSTTHLFSMLSFFVRPEGSEGVDFIYEIAKHILMDRLAICEKEQKRFS